MAPDPPRLPASPGSYGRGRRGLEGAVPQGGGASSRLLGSRGWRKLVSLLGAPRERSGAGRPFNFGRARPRLWGLKLCLDPPRNLQDSRGWSLAGGGQAGSGCPEADFSFPTTLERGTSFCSSVRVFLERFPAPAPLSARRGHAPSKLEREKLLSPGQKPRPQRGKTGSRPRRRPSPLQPQFPCPWC